MAHTPLEGAIMPNEFKPISLYPLTPEEATRRATRAPAPKKEAALPPAQSKLKLMPKAKKAGKKKG
jgi:hypothetical protein